MPEIEPTAPVPEAVYIDQEQGYAMLKSLASWLSILRPEAQLCDAVGHIYVADPHICAQLVRMCCPNEGRA